MCERREMYELYSQTCFSGLYTGFVDGCMGLSIVQRVKGEKCVNDSNVFFWFNTGLAYRQTGIG